MTSGLYAVLTIETIIAFLIVYLIQIPIRKISNRIVLAVLFVLKVLLTLYLGMTLIAFDYAIVWNHEYPFMGMYLALIPDIFADIIFFIVSFFRKDKDNTKPRFIVAAVLTALFFCYNVINMQTIIPKYHEITSSKLKREYTLVFFSDLHYGSSQSKNTVDKALDRIQELKPDCLLLGGDITDENTTKEEMEYIYQKIGSLDIPVYFVYGNHDRQDRGWKVGGQKFTEEELEKAITGNGITILYEDYVKINDDLVLLGREDPSRPEKRKAVKDLPSIPRNCYVVTIDHTPYQTQEIIELKADLQLSGHTHAAQFFPIQTIYKILNLNVLGDYYIGDTHLYVSPGISGWALPLRSEGHCQYEVFELKPE